MQSAVPWALTQERSGTISLLLFLRELFTTALPFPPTFYSKYPAACAHPACCTMFLTPVWFGHWGLRRRVGYASPCRLLYALCSQGCLLCGPQASGLWRVEYHLLIYHGWWGMGKLYNWNTHKSLKKKKRTKKEIKVKNNTRKTLITTQMIISNQMEQIKEEKRQLLVTVLNDL